MHNDGQIHLASEDQLSFEEPDLESETCASSFVESALADCHCPKVHGRLLCSRQEHVHV
jgi:hypothetical protein